MQPNITCPKRTRIMRSWKDLDRWALLVKMDHIDPALGEPSLQWRGSRMSAGKAIEFFLRFSRMNDGRAKRLLAPGGIIAAECIPQKGGR